MSAIINVSNGLKFILHFICYAPNKIIQTITLADSSQILAHSNNNRKFCIKET